MVSKSSIIICRAKTMAYNKMLKEVRPFMLSAILLSVIFLLFCNNYNTNYMVEEVDFISTADNTDDNYAIKSQTCHIPAMRPINNMIEKYVGYPDIKPCPNRNYSLLARNGTHIWLDADTRLLRHYGVPIQKHKDINCCYSSFSLRDDTADIDQHNIDQRIKYDQCIYFNDAILVEDEFVSVRCHYHSYEIYSQYYAFALLKSGGEKEINSLYSTNKYNVLIVGIDNLSRLNFHRTMQKTASFMKDRGAVELMGYNKIGDNSYPNLLALITGHTADEIQEICNPVKGYDNCPFLWNAYKGAGFYTAFGEDSGYLETFNNFVRKGSFNFEKTPTDYYLHPFISEAERVGARYKEGNVFMCIYEHYLYQILLDYIQAVTDTLWDRKLFAFFWEITMSHDDINYPMIIDDSYTSFFRHLETTGYLDKSIIFLVSDHGMRWGEFRRTKQGYLEERLPLALVLAPPSFRNNYKQAFANLQHNSKQLTTPFDLHETWVDLIHLEDNRDEAMQHTKYSSNNWGISLFAKVPENRSCESAGIVDHWCACNPRVPMSNTSTEIINASKYLIEYINELLSEYPQCAILTLDEIQESAKFQFIESKKWDEYSVVVSVKPSGGVFEATLRYAGGWSTIGTVSRLNLYGDQSICANKPLIKLYCYCEAN